MAKWNLDKIRFSEIEAGLFLISAGEPGKISRFSYLLQRPKGNVLIHGPDAPGFYDRFRSKLDALGGIGLQLLTHKDEASPAATKAWKIWNAPLRVHALDEAMARHRARAGVPIETFDNEPTFSALKAYWLPGHSAGFTGYIFKGSRGTYLFSGDLVWRRRGAWVGSGHLDWYRHSLNRMARLKFNYLLPNKGDSSLPPPIEWPKALHREASAAVLADIGKRNAARARRAGR